MFTFAEDEYFHKETHVENVEVRRDYLRKKIADPVIHFEMLEYLYHHPQYRYIEYLLADEYRPTWLGEPTRKVFFDIETYYMPDDSELQIFFPTGSTHMVNKQRLGFAASMDDRGQIFFWRESQAGEFLAYLLTFDEIVSYNGLAFDNQVLAGYTGSPENVQALYNKSLDLMLLFQMRDALPYPRSLGYYADLHLSDAKLPHRGKSIPIMLRMGNEEEQRGVRFYCLKDVDLTRRLYEERHAAAHKDRFAAWQLDFINHMIQQMVKELPIEATPHTPARQRAVRIPEFFWHPEVVQLRKAFEEECRTLFAEVQVYAEAHLREFLVYVSGCGVDSWAGTQLIRTSANVSSGAWEAKLLLFESRLKDDRYLNRLLHRVIPLYGDEKLARWLKSFKIQASSSWTLLVEETDGLARAVRHAGAASNLPSPSCLELQDEKGNSHIIMPAVTATVLCHPGVEEALERAIFIFHDRVAKTSKRMQAWLSDASHTAKLKPLSAAALHSAGLCSVIPLSHDNSVEQYLNQEIIPRLDSLIEQYERKIAAVIKEPFSRLHEECRQEIESWRIFTNVFERDTWTETELKCRYTLLYIEWQLTQCSSLHDEARILAEEFHRQARNAVTLDFGTPKRGRGRVKKIDPFRPRKDPFIKEGLSGSSRSSDSDAVFEMS